MSTEAELLVRQLGISRDEAEIRARNLRKAHENAACTKRYRLLRKSGAVSKANYVGRAVLSSSPIATERIIARRTQGISFNGEFDGSSILKAVNGILALRHAPNLKPGHPSCPATTTVDGVLATYSRMVDPRNAQEVAQITTYPLIPETDLATLEEQLMIKAILETEFSDADFANFEKLQALRMPDEREIATSGQVFPNTTVTQDLSFQSAPGDQQ